MLSHLYFIAYQFCFFDRALPYQFTRHQCKISYAHFYLLTFLVLAVVHILLCCLQEYQGDNALQSD